jgi:hypothetical protein
MLVLLSGALICYAAPAARPVDNPVAAPPASLVLPAAAATPQALPISLLPTSAKPTPTPSVPTPTSTRVISFHVEGAAIVRANERATAEANNKALVMAHLNDLNQPPPRLKEAKELSYSQTSPLVLAHYFAWYEADGWNDCNISAGDKPLAPYDSNDPAAIARHIQMAQAAGLNGFAMHWFAPGERTDQNFRTLLNQAAGSDFVVTLVFSYHIFYGVSPTQQNVAEALRYIIEQYGQHPNFLRLDQRPVIFFTDVYRVPAGNGQSPQQAWTAIRAQVDPQHQGWWIAEGLDASYLELFDGLYVFKVSHATSPHDYVKSPRWGQRVRDMTQQTGQPKLWVATISPGWDDLRSGCITDVRVPSPPHKLGRANGQTYEAMFQAALESKPDWVIVGSFNEWIEGTYIEPSEQYGDKYIQMTRAFVEQFQNR